MCKISQESRMSPSSSVKAWTCRLMVIVIVGFSATTQATLVDRGVGSGCSEAPRCAASASVPSMGLFGLSLNVSGLVETHTLVSEEADRVILGWDTVFLSGAVEGLGPITFRLNPDIGPSLAIIESIVGDEFPAKHTNLYYFEVELLALGLILENRVPVELTSTINDWPPDRDVDHRYLLVDGPAEFYIKGDQMSPLIFTIDSAEVTLESNPETTLSGSLTTYFHEHDGDANSISIDLGGGPVSTGPISFELNPSDPNSYEIFNFDTMTVIEESDVLVSVPGLGLVGADRLAVHISEAGTITGIDPNTFIPGVETYFEMTTDLTGEIIIPPGSPFEGFTWTNEKIQILSGYITIDEDGEIEIGFEWVKVIAVSGEITPPGQDPIPLDIAGIGLLRSDPAPDLCDHLLLIGDLDGDCKVGLSDFALMAGNWLIDCDLTPLEPACAP